MISFFGGVRANTLTLSEQQYFVRTLPVKAQNYKTS